MFAGNRGRLRAGERAAARDNPGLNLAAMIGHRPAVIRPFLQGKFRAVGTRITETFVKYRLSATSMTAGSPNPWVTGAPVPQGPFRWRRQAARPAGAIVLAEERTDQRLAVRAPARGNARHGRPAPARRPRQHRKKRCVTTSTAASCRTTTDLIKHHFANAQRIPDERFVIVNAALTRFQA